MTITRKAFLSAVASAALLMCAAQAQANPFIFSQSFNGGGITGTVTGTFSAVDTNANTQFEASEISFLTLSYAGTVPTLGAISLSFTPPNIVTNPTVTNWYATDTNLGASGNGFFVSGTAAASTQMVWVAGPANGFSFGNLGGPNGDPQNSTFNFGQVSFFTGNTLGETLLGNANSQTYASVTVVPEPATYLMMLGGIAALAVGARRRAAGCRKLQQT